jgi:hypothetical protein
LDRGDYELSVALSESYGTFGAGQFSLATRVGLASGLLFLPADSAVRLYADLGVFAELWTDTVGSDWASFLSLGLSPEGGVIWTIAPFRVRLGLGYDFDIARYVTATQSAASVAGLDVSKLTARLSVSYFLR